jgi:hypothetical protein
MKDRLGLIAFALIGLALLLVPVAYFRALHQARHQLELFEYSNAKDAGRQTSRRQVAVLEANSSSRDSQGRREYRVIDQEPGGLSAFAEMPRAGQLIDLTTGDGIHDWYVAEIRRGEIWESRDGRAIQLSGGVLYNLVSQRILVAISGAFAACGFALLAWRRHDDSDKMSTSAKQSVPSRDRTHSDVDSARPLSSKDPDYAKCSRCGFEQWASYRKCQRCGARFVTQ